MFLASSDTRIIKYIIRIEWRESSIFEGIETSYDAPSQTSESVIRFLSRLMANGRAIEGVTSLFPASSVFLLAFSQKNKVSPLSQHAKKWILSSS
jgi:hypothetical protein